ncbi:hypothetical protein Tco_0261042 [Tanacetum coccineum]
MDHRSTTAGPPVNYRWTTGQPSSDHRSTTAGLPVNHRWTTGQPPVNDGGQRVPRGSVTSTGGDPLSDVSSNVAPCGDDVEIAKKAMTGFETMTSRL